MLASCLLVGSAVLASPQDPTDSWPQFLGSDSARAAGATTLTFDRDRDLRYRVPVPPGKSSPCIHGDRIFLTGLDGEELVLVALGRRTGKELWRHAVPAPKPRKFDHVDAGFAMPTPCTNGERVFCYFPTHGLIARTVDGEPAWEKTLPETNGDFGYGSSPTLCGDLVVLLRDGCPDARLYALHEATGELAWELPRVRQFDSHATPYVWRNQERTELVIASTGTVAGHDPKTGRELWRVEGLSPLVCTTPVGDAEQLYFAAWSTPAAAGVDRFTDGMEETVELTEEEKRDPAALLRRFDKDGDEAISLAEAPAGRVRAAFGALDADGDGALSIDEWMSVLKFPRMGKNLAVAIRAGGAGDVTQTHVTWQQRRGVPYVSSPLLHDGRVWLVKAGGVVSCFQAKSGEPVFRRERLGDTSEYYATPVAVDGHVVVCSSAGTIYVLEAADELQVVREVEFGEKLFATPAVVAGDVFVRTDAALYAFGTGAGNGR